MKNSKYYIKFLLSFLFALIPLNGLLAADSSVPNTNRSAFVIGLEILLLVLFIICTGLLIYLIILRKKNNLLSIQKSVSDNSLLYTLIDNMPDRIYIKDRKSRFIAGNKHVAKIMGAKSPKDIVGKTDFDFYAKDLAGEFFHDEQYLMDSGENLINKEERGLDINGNEVIVSTTKVPIKNENGEIVGIVGIGRDITKQKQNERMLITQQENVQEINTLLEERQEEIKQQSEELHSQSEYLMKVNQELEKLSLVASRTENVITIMDADANIEWGNNIFKNQYGIDLEELLKTSMINLREISTNENIKNILDEIQKTKKGVTYEAKTLGKGGKEVWSQTTISPVLNEKNEIVKLIAIDSDITQLKEAEKKIENSSEELKKLNATKDKFFSIIAHDLKNPFHSIMGFSELLIRSYQSIEDNRKKEFLQLINDSSTSAYNLLENLLDWSRTQTNRINYIPKNINVSQILHDNIQIHSVIAQNKEIKIETQITNELISYADLNMINTIVRNLLTNALKFTPKGGKILVEGKIENENIKVSVIDSGIGMNKADMDKLFRIDEFHNTAGTEGETGTGLGLIVCHEFIAKHDGVITVQSEPGKGSTFSFSLPPASPASN